MAKEETTARNQTNDTEVLPVVFDADQSLDGIKIDDYILFGKYPYSKDGKEKPIEWIVKRIKDDQIFLVSRYVIDIMPFHTKNKGMIWEKSPLRQWLNTEFIETAFTKEEEERLIPTEIVFNDYSFLSCPTPCYKMSTVDRVFLLGKDEIERLWPLSVYNRNNSSMSLPDMHYRKKSSTNMRASFTPYASAKRPRDERFSNINYFLRDNEAFKKNMIGCIANSLNIDKLAYFENSYGCSNKVWFTKVSNPGGIRPAIWIKCNPSPKG